MADLTPYLKARQLGYSDDEISDYVSSSGINAEKVKSWGAPSTIIDNSRAKMIQANPAASWRADPLDYQPPKQAIQEKIRKNASSLPSIIRPTEQEIDSGQFSTIPSLGRGVFDNVAKYAGILANKMGDTDSAKLATRQQDATEAIKQLKNFDNPNEYKSSRNQIDDTLDYEKPISKRVIDTGSDTIGQLVHTLVSPSTWTAEGMSALPTDPMNFVGLGAGKAGSLVENQIGKRVLGATAGATTQGASQAMAGYESAKARGKSEKEASEEALSGLIGGVAMGAPLGVLHANPKTRPNLNTPLSGMTPDEIAIAKNLAVTPESANPIMDNLAKVVSPKQYEVLKESLKKQGYDDDAISGMIQKQIEPVPAPLTDTYQKLLDNGYTDMEARKMTNPEPSIFGDVPTEPKAYATTREYALTTNEPRAMSEWVQKSQTPLADLKEIIKRNESEAASQTVGELVTMRAKALGITPNEFARQIPVEYYKNATGKQFEAEGGFDGEQRHQVDSKEKQRIGTLMPFNMMGTKNHLLAEMTPLSGSKFTFSQIVQDAGKSGRVIDAFGGAGTYTHFLADKGILPKGSILNEFDNFRATTHKWIKQAPQEVDKFVAELMKPLADKNGVTINKDSIGFIKNKQQYIDDLVQSTYSSRNKDANTGMLPVHDNARTAAVYLIAQKHRLNQVPVNAEGGKTAGNMIIFKASKGTSWSKVQAGEGSVTYKVKTPHSISEAGSRLQNTNITHGDGWELIAKEAKQGDTVFVDTSYLNKVDDSGKITDTTNYNKATAEDAVPDVYKKKIDEFVVPALRRGADVVITNNWDDGVASFLRSKGLKVYKGERQNGAELIATSRNYGEGYKGGRSDGGRESISSKQSTATNAGRDGEVSTSRPDDSTVSKSAISRMDATTKGDVPEVFREDGQGATRGIDRGLATDYSLKGAYDIDNKLIRIFKGADSSTLVHELGHRFWFTLTNEERSMASKIWGVDKEGWTEAHHEKFADAFARYVAEGKTQHSGLRAIFEKFKEYAKSILKSLIDNNDGRLPDISDDARVFFRAMLGDEKARVELKRSVDIRGGEVLPKEISGQLMQRTAPHLLADTQLTASIKDDLTRAKVEAVRAKGIISEALDGLKDMTPQWYRDIKDNANIGKAKGADAAELYNKAMRKFSDDTNRVLQQYIVGDIKTLPAGYETLHPLAIGIRGEVKARTEKLITQGGLTREGAEVWGDNYLKRSYANHWDEKNNIKPASSTGIEAIHARGKTETVSSDELTRIQNAGEIGSVRDGKWKIEETKKDGTTVIRRDWTKAERENMGEIENASVTVPNTLLALDQMIENYKMMRELTQYTGEFKNFDEAKAAGYDQMPDSPRYGNLAGLYIDRHVADRLKYMFEDKSNGFRLWQQFQSVWKMGKTAWNAASHVNNYMGNLVTVLMMGKDLGQGMKMLGSSLTHTRDFVAGNMSKFEDLRAKEFAGTLTTAERQTYADLTKKLKYYIEGKEIGLFGRGQVHDILRGFDAGTNSFDKKGLIRKSFETVSHIYGRGDDAPRLAAYSVLRKEGMEAIAAKKFVNSLFPDYTQELPPLVRKLRDYGLSPFIAWSYYVLPNMWKLTKSHPTRAAGVLSAAYLASYMASGINPFGDEIPDDAQGRRLPVSSDGTTLKVDRMLPAFDFAALPLDAGSKLVKGFQRGDVLGGANDALKSGANDVGKLATSYLWGGLPAAAAGAITNTDPYTKRPISGDTDNGAHQAYNYLKYLANTLAPAEMGKLASSIQNQIAPDEVKRKYSDINPRTSIQDLLNILGLNMLTYDGSEVERKRDDKQRASNRKSMRD